MNQELRDKIADRRIIASVSGGKDSAAVRLYLREIGIPDAQIKNVAMDTGWEWDGWREYVEGPLAATIGPIEIICAEIKRLDLIDMTALRPRVRAAVEAGSAMVQLILRKGMFPSRHRRFCTEELKVFPMQAYLSALGEDAVNTVGIRRAESKARSEMAEWEWSDGFDCEVWRPLIAWTMEEVIAIHQRHGLVPNPLYLKGFRRVGCFPCIHENKDGIRLIADNTPERIDLVRDLEFDVGRLQRARYDARVAAYEAGGADALSTNDRRALLDESDGEIKVKPFQAPSWFQAPTSKYGTMPIDRVVEWSRTIRGGRIEDRQENLFAGMNDGCMRWGLCETAPDGDE